MDGDISAIIKYIFYKIQKASEPSEVMAITGFGNLSDCNKIL